MQLYQGQFWLAGAISLGCLLSSESAIAQISSDGIIPTNVNRSGNILEITGGATAGTNLFHSFRDFSVPTGDIAYFNNALNIQNIISRVTGSSISDIDGILKANGTASLYLINPNGIIFGPNASLDIGGSFVASTASSIQFADGTEFSAVNPSAPPLLTVSVPIGLQFNGNEGNLIVRAGSGSTADSVNENGDAGSVLDMAQIVNTSDTLPRAISGTLSQGNDVDLYQIYLPANQPFQATTVGGSVVDTQLFLFDSSGRGLYTNDDSAGTLASTMPASAFTPSTSGTYYLGISACCNDPTSTNGLIFDYASATPTGPGAGFPLSGWDNEGQDTGAYIIRLNGSRFSKPGGLQVKPGQTLALVGGQVSLEGA
ncbi:DVUA0089 family protein, partial [Allocoleopsis sp.]|uniref:filamentous hemagglutinin N-terminal domain-containing protein n=1 Tax=Allocoleopsis sp. TaxID=3088169 RepID=UPI002FD70D1D